MKNYKIVLLSGDGIGPEISNVSKKILTRVSEIFDFNIEIEEELFGGIAYRLFLLECRAWCFLPDNLSKLRSPCPLTLVF